MYKKANKTSSELLIELLLDKCKKTFMLVSI